MSKTLIVSMLLLLVICLVGVGWLVLRDQSESSDELQPGTIREDSLDIQTDNPQPAGRNIQPTE